MALTADRVSRYLERIGFNDAVGVDVATLEALQRAHMSTVPFENLHVFYRRQVETAAAWSVTKIVEGERGGWCFELNGAFAELLIALGFEVTRLGASVMLSGRSPSRLDHMTLQVDLDVPYLVDVGFGDSFIRPLRMDLEGPQDGGVRSYRLRREGGFIHLESADGDEWEPNFRFDLAPRDLSEFESSSHALQTEPGLHWTEAPFATRLLDGGPDRVWLLHDRIKFRRSEHMTHRDVAPTDWAGTLQAWFGLNP